MRNIRLPARQESLHALIGFVSGMAKERGFSPKRILEMELAVEEALVNILTYAYPKTTGDIEIVCRDEDSSPLCFEIIDDGVAFDPLSLPVPNLLAELAIRQVGGLGVFLLRQMADHVTYRRLECANVLTLIFTRRESQNRGNEPHNQGT